MRWLILVTVVTLSVPLVSRAQVSSERLLKASEEPRNWLTYSGAYNSQRHSQLRQIGVENVANLEMKWVHQTLSGWSFETSPLVVDGIMYFTQGPNNVVALDAESGRIFWIFRYTPDPNFKACCGAANRGLAVLGDTLFMGTIDAHLLAIDAKTGQQVWDTKVAETTAGYALTLAPLVVRGKVLVGNAGGEFGTRGFVAAYDPRTGKQVWRFHTIPGPGEPGSETWPSAEWTERGGAPVWLTGSYDPTLNLTYWGTGNPGLDYNAKARPGDNLYSNSVVALDADTGKLRWHFQFTPNDAYDFDAVQIPVLVDMPWEGSPRKLMLWGNRNGFFYVLDRTNGAFLAGYPFVKVNWASGLDKKTGRPIQTPQPDGAITYPCHVGATNWQSPSYSPLTGLFYMTIWENCGEIYTSQDQPFRVGQAYVGGRPLPAIPGTTSPGVQGSQVNTGSEAIATGAVVAIEPQSLQRRWTFPTTNVSLSGVLTTASHVAFVGSREGYFHALDARTGNLLWRATLGGEIKSGPITYEVRGRQFVTLAAGTALFTFGLREPAAKVPSGP
jgi:alcohol dehydrogenase (cytochrome c)